MIRNMLRNELRDIAAYRRELSHNMFDAHSVECCEEIMDAYSDHYTLTYLFIQPLFSKLSAALERISRAL